MDEAAESRQKAEACRRLAEIEDTPERKALWLKRADEWQQRAIQAAKLRPREPT